MSADGAGAVPPAELPGSITTVHRYELPLPRKEVWELISDVSQYRTWWPWLRSFDAAALAEGEEWHCLVQPPMPYLVRFGVTIDHVEVAALVRATVSGDVVGHATLTLDDADGRLHGDAAQLAGAREQGPAADVPFRRPRCPFRARLGPRFGRPPVHRPRRRTLGGRVDTQVVKFSFRQILASTAGAVVAAIIASTFGVKGTIVGVAIGSAAATMATALVAQSIERGHEAVKQVVVKAPETATLLRKLGGTGASGDTLATSSASASSSASSAPTEVVRSGPPDDGNAETVEMESTAAPVGETELEISAVADAPATERLRASTSPMRPAVRRPALAGRFSWRAIAATAAVVFVLALAVHHGDRADLGQAALGDLRRIRRGHDAEESRHPVAGTGDHADDHAVDHDHDHVDDLDHVDHDHDARRRERRRRAPPPPPVQPRTTTTSPAPATTTTTVVSGRPPRRRPP